MISIPIDVNEYRVLNAIETRLEQMSKDLRAAVRNKELFLLYQPQLDLKTGRVCGVEALVRWRHPRLGVLEPKWFIPLATKMGIIGELDAWAINEACRQARIWLDWNEFSGTVSVNVCSLDLCKPEFELVVYTSLERHRIAPATLILEITESNAMDDPERTLIALGHLVKAGIAISLDDFGVGHSSLAQLRRLPIAEMKIDQSFIKPIDASAEDAAIVTAIIAMAKALGIKVVAEGVETMAQLAVLVQLGCGIVQGHYVGLPMTPDELARSWRDFETIVME